VPTSAVLVTPEGGFRAPLVLMRFLPAVVGLGAVLLAETVRGAPIGDALLYKLFLVLAVALPGTIVWRMINTDSRSFLEDVTFGSILGLAIEVILMWLLDFVQLQRLAIGWAAIVIVLSLAVPRYRSAWTRRAPSSPPRVTWSVVLSLCLSCSWVWRLGFGTNLVQRIPGTPDQWFTPQAYVDNAFHQALASAVTRVPMLDPFGPDGRLWYEIMVHEHMADVYQWTGIDLTLIVARLFALPLVVLTLCMSAVLAGRFVRSEQAQALAPVFMVLTAVLSPFQFDTTMFFGSSSIGTHYVLSPTLAFCVPLFLATVGICAMFLSERRPPFRLLPFLFIIAFAAQGAKATPVPMLVCGVAFALIVGTLSRPRADWRRLLLLLGVTAAAFVATFVFIYGGSSREMAFTNGHFTLSGTALTMLGDLARLKVLMAALALFIAVWLISVAPIIVVTIFRQLDTRMVLAVGSCAAGVVAGLFGQAAGHSEVYFLMTLWPLAATLAAISVDYLYAKVLNRRLRGHVGLLTLLAVGAITTVVTRNVLGWKPADPVSGWAGLATLLRPLLGTLTLMVVIAVTVLMVAARRTKSDKTQLGKSGLALILILIQGGLSAQLITNNSPIVPPFLLNPTSNVWTGGGVTVPADGATAARWVRDHSTPDSVLVTNMHCLPGSTGDTCVARHYWLTALSERPVLLEGWAYSQEAFKRAGAGSTTGPFWDQAFFDMNDRAIRDPDAQTRQWMRNHSVSWIVVDRSVFPEGSALVDQAQLMFTSGDFAVYQVIK